MKKTVKTITAAALVLGLAGCGSSSKAEDKTITVGATTTPHAEILNNVVKDILAEEGWTLEVVEFADYVQPNTQLDAGDLDANYFQTLGYMQTTNEDNGFSLVAAVGVHIEPMGIYSEKITKLSDLADGASIGVPNDTDNEDRAIRLLISLGLLKDPGTDAQLKETDFNGNSELNPHNYEIVPIEAGNLPSNLPDVDCAVINGNYALLAGLPESNPAIEIEEFDAETSVKRTNYIVVNEKDLESEKTKALVAAITSDKVQEYIENTYKGSVITSFIDAEGNSVK